MVQIEKVQQWSSLSGMRSAVHPWNAGNDKLIICCSRQLENRGYCDRETKKPTDGAMMSHRVFGGEGGRGDQCM